MDKQQKTYFEALTVNRSEAAKALEGFALQGVKNSVVEKYSDQAHFIYELLQNADDAKATSARFELFKDKLIFAHNGARHFSISNPATEADDHRGSKLGDINAITAVGSSNKNDEATIGKFGVGFKAVFQYTITPHIYDPGVFFRIERFIVPIEINEDYPGRHDDETLFVFPFDHDKRSPDETYTDIFEKLRSLDFPLLFLVNLKEITYKISGILGFYGKKIEESRKFNDTTAEFITLTQNEGEKGDDLSDSMLWLFSRDDGNGHTYSVGFFVDDYGHLIPKKHNAFCFFPTKAVTGLNFIIHAPFLLTDSREGIRAGVQHNLDMISMLSDLAADSLVYLRDIGLSKDVHLIDDNIFDIIPYDESGFGDVNSKNAISYKPFYNAFKELIRREAIIPAIGKYVTTANAYWAFVPQIAELISNDQLAYLTKNQKAHWVFTSFGRQDTLRKNKALTDYIDSITKVWLDEKDILTGWSITSGDSFKGITSSFIEAQSVEWLHRFYQWIAETKGRTELILTKPIFLNQNMKAVAAFKAEKQPILFLPVDGGSGYDTVNEVLLENDETVAFIKQIGVSEPSLRDEISNIILPQYKDNGDIDTNPHFKKFFLYYQTCTQAEAKTFLSIIKDYSFVFNSSEADETQYRGMPSQLYFPFEPLKKWFKTKPNTRFVSYDDYLELIGEDHKEELVTFLRDIGVRDLPRILSRELSHQEAMQIRSDWPYSAWRRTWTEKSIDGCAELIDSIVEEGNANLSVLLWSQLLKLIKAGFLDNSNYWDQNNVLFGRCEYFYYHAKFEPFESNEAKRLRTRPWLLNTDGEFVAAGDLWVQTLNQQYDLESVEAVELLHILGIEEESTELNYEDIDITSFGEKLGLSEEEQRQALVEFAQKKNADESGDEFSFDISADEKAESNDYERIDEGDDGETTVISRQSIKRTGEELTKRAISTSKEIHPDLPDVDDDTPTDEDDYSKPAVDINKQIEKVNKQAEREIQEITRLKILRDKAQEAKVYSFGWFKSLLELESLNRGDHNSNSREISISFSKVEREEGTSRTLILRHPSRYIPQSMEDLADIPLELHFGDQPMIKVAVEVVSVKSYTLRAKLRTNAKIDGVDLSKVTEARIEARNPVFLIEELRKAFIRLGEENGYEDDFDMKSNLCGNIEFVFGPPGTGKTTHVARDILVPMMRSDQDLKVLVLTPTNKAADVLVRHLMESMGSDKSYINWLVRFGATNDNTIEQSGVFRDKTFDIRALFKHVTVTTIARFPYDYFLPDQSTRLHLNALKWDYIIIDEASMIPLANIIYPLYKKSPAKFVIAGDPFQIEPITTVDAWKNENIYTMVELNSFTEPKTVPHDYDVKLLTTQYRSTPEIGEVFSRFAYGGVLKHYRSSTSQRKLPIEDLIDLKPVNIIKFPVSKFESIFRPKRLQNKSTYQVYSALFAFEFVKNLASLIEMGKEDELISIGLIAPYRAQADLIDKLMITVTMPKNVDVQVGTIHGFQGDECDIIIALFNPPPKISTHQDMFLNKLNIVNVSISRARDYLIVLMPNDETEDIDNLKLIKRVETICKSQPTCSEQFSPLIEEIMFGSKTYLEDNSFSTSHQLVNVYGKPEKRYEVRSEDNAVDVQIHE